MSLAPELVAKMDNPRWQIRNKALKDIGKQSDEVAKEHLIQVIQDRRPSTFIKRALGEPFYQVGFIRRNAWTALLNQNLETTQFFEILPIGLADPYYEVRTATWKVIKHMFEKIDFDCSEEWRKQLSDKVVQEKNFEIFLAMLPALEHIMSNEEILSLAGKVRRFKPWRVRGAFFDLLCSLYEKKRLSYDELKPHLNTVHLRSDYFKPIFLLKEKRQNLDKLIEVDQ